MPLPRSKLRMSEPELDTFLSEARTCRIATVSPSGQPHVAPLWFVWHDKALWISSLKKSRRTRDLEAGSQVAVCVDTGIEYSELKGCVLYGSFEPAPEGSDFEEARKLFADEYFGGLDLGTLRSHKWLRLRPDRIASWDFAKIPPKADPRLADRPS